MKGKIDVNGKLLGTGFIDERGEDPATVVGMPRLDSQGRTPWRVVQAVTRDDVLDPDTGAVIGRRITSRGEKLREGPDVVIQDPLTEAFMEPGDFGPEEQKHWVHRDELLWEEALGRFTKPYERGL